MPTVNLAPLVATLAAAIKSGESAKSTFNRVGKICQDFYIGATDAQWGAGMRKDYMGSLPAPQFKIVLNRVFELVSLVSPSLMWSAPGRQITGYGKLDIPPEVFALTQGLQPDDPMFAQVVQQHLMEEQQEEAMASAARALMERYLNYTPRETPGGGLRTESHLAIIDALIKGRGVMRVDTYNPVGTNDVLTGAFHVPVDDLIVDPDCTRCNLSNAKWIAIRHIQPHWEVERKFGWPAGSLKGKSTMESKQSAAANRNTMDGIFHRKSDTSDLCVWWEMFSKMGVGSRLRPNPIPQWHDAFESSVGDFAHLCFIKGMPELLNLRSDFLATASPDEVRMQLSWPHPYHMDGRWPIACLDFWANPGSAWPLATVAMGLGELMFLNVMISSLAERIYRGGLTKIAIRQELAEDCTAKLLSFQHEVVELNPAIAENINQMVSYLQQPPVDFDAFRMIEHVSQMFDKRVGLMELMYGLNPGGKVSRTASDANIKGEAVSVRPEFMASQVEAFQTEIADLERIAAGDAVRGESLIPLLGRSGASLWTQLITNADPKVYMREMRSRLEANSMRKPNKRKDNENMQQFGAFMLPVAQWYAGATGNTEPLNAFLKSMGKATDQDVDSWLMPPINQEQQGPSEEELAAMQEMAAIDMADKKAKLTNREMANSKLAHEMLENGQGIPQEFLAGAVPADTFQAPIPTE
jgi:hypothetical protein